MREVVALGIMKGYSEGVYGPNNSITRAEFATFISRMDCLVRHQVSHYLLMLRGVGG
ncbi:S-layer homology domain-containing protein [Anaerobacillus sp. HL2]|nr:S-layer homology domain-containing protein [Anaerobacillus sp. HL2]